MKTILASKLHFIFSLVVISILFLSIGCSSNSITQRIIEAQPSQSKTPAKETIQKDLEFLRGIKNPCDYIALVGLNTDPEVRKLYDLLNAGFPKETSIEEAAATFNRFAECDDRSKTQPPLTAEEITAAIRDWDCSEESDKDDKKFCADAWKITETGKMPKGSLFVFDRGMRGGSRVRGYQGFYVKTWEISLYLYLDKYRFDLKDVPIFQRTIRLKYISSEAE